MRDQGSVVELVLNAQRRIRLLERVDEFIEDEKFTKLNSRRTRKHSRGDEKSAKRKLDDAATAIASESGSGEKKAAFAATGEQTIIYGRTENVNMETVEKTVELKARL